MLSDFELDELARRPQPLGSQTHGIAVLLAELARLLEKRADTRRLIDKNLEQNACHEKTVADTDAKAADVRRLLREVMWGGRHEGTEARRHEVNGTG